MPQAAAIFHQTAATIYWTISCTIGECNGQLNIITEDVEQKCGHFWGRELTYITDTQPFPEGRKGQNAEDSLPLGRRVIRSDERNGINEGPAPKWGMTNDVCGRCCITRPVERDLGYEKLWKNGMSRMTRFSCPVVGSFFNHTTFSAVTKPQSTFLRLMHSALSIFV